MNYNHLNINERTVISLLASSDVSIREIAKQLGRSPSTISRELKRNQTNERDSWYIPLKAQEIYQNRKHHCGRKYISCEDTLSYVKYRIEDHWSPEQIANRKTAHKVPSTSTIYRMIHQKRLGPITMARLRRKGNFTRPAETRGKFNDGGRTIKKRPKDVYKRKELGHWEGDTVVFGKIDRKCKSSACFVTLAERKSRMYIAIKVPNRTAEIVSQAIIKALKDFPEDMVKTITFDRGKEFAGYEDIENALHCSTYFCDPYCAWQKGTNENANGLLREFYPKGMDRSLVDEDELKHNLELMNNRPRKFLGYKTPNEVMNETDSHTSCCT